MADRGGPKRVRVKGRTPRREDLAELLSDAAVRAVHWAPEPLLQRFGERDIAPACRRLALRVMVELAGDGWRAGWAGSRRPCGEGGSHARDADRCLDGAQAAIAEGLVAAGPHLLAVISEVRRVNGRLLDGVGCHMGEAILLALRRRRVRLMPCWSVPVMRHPLLSRGMPVAVGC